MLIESRVIKSGERKREARYKISFTKTEKQWVAKQNKEKKDYHYVEKLVDNVVNAYKTGNNNPVTHGVNLPNNIATSAPPCKAIRVKEHRSRFTC